MENDQNLQINLVSLFQKGFCPFIFMFFDLLPTLSIFFHVKIQLFVTLKSDQDPDRTAWIRIGLAP